MQNYSPVFQQTLGEFTSPLVPAGQEDAGKGQVLVRAGYKINLANPSIGFLSKSPGQTQYLGVAVDVLLDRNDGSWDDYLSDIPAANGMREIVVRYTPHSGSPNPSNWVQPTFTHTQQPGPLTLSNPVPGPDPGPDPGPTPPANNDEVMAKLEEMQAQSLSQTRSIIEVDNANTAKIQQQIADVVEDMEESLKKIMEILLPIIGGEQPSTQSSLSKILGGLFSRSKANKEKS